MATYLHSNSLPEEICLNYRKEGKNESLNCPTDLTDEVKISDITLIGEKECLIKDDIPEKLEIGNINSGDLILTKSSNIIETQERSPFKQVVKGFVLNKLSRKGGTPHLLSGLTDKIVKKLEEGRENTQNVTQVLPGEKNRGKESSIELSNELIPCELKSVVANDVSELPSVEEATECFEESKNTNNIEGKKLFLKPKLTKERESKSLPSSPARHSSCKVSSEIDHSSDSEEKSSISEFNNISSFSSKLFQNLNLETGNFNYDKEIEFNNMNIKHSEKKCHDPSNSNSVEYLENAYIQEKDGSKKLFSVYKYQHTFLTLKNIILQLRLPHILLLLSIIIHNSKTFSTYYIDWIFDCFIVSYVIYTLLCIIIQIPPQEIPFNVTYDDTQLEMTSIHQSERDKEMKGSVKILKGEYDLEEQNNFAMELVNMCIESQCLKISLIPKANESVEIMDEPYEVYDLCGAEISLVPKGLPKRRVFRKKFPICIKLPLASQKYSINDTSDDFEQEEKCDYVSLFPFQDGLLETPKRRALYIFALTDREKETWFYALKKCSKAEELNVTEYSCLYSSSPKLDITSMSYSSLLEMNSDETLSITEDSSGIGTEIAILPNKTKPTLQFESFVKTLFENYLRETNISEHSWKSDTSKKKDTQFRTYTVEWLNVALGRLFYDFLTQKCWSVRVIEKIQKKLNQLEMPSFMETLEVTDVSMGTCIPQLHSVSNITVDEFGIWFDFDFTYNGSFQMTLQTKLKMPKNKQQLQNDENTENSDVKQNNEVNESSDEDGSGSIKSPKQNKFINKIEKWISHKHFQTVAQSRFVKKYVGDISNMLLTLTVEVHVLQGILAVNIPPVPTDRIWYGFRKDPTLSLTASPKVGSHEINLSAIVKMIEQRLIRAFKKAIVMPHMDDLIIPLMFTSAYDE
ncbi:testis-expressed protein 2 [Caerostris darwini]|uniref:Testis-expressed protein 2 n=1 Tax=Caerostris darwini TaxID=1538125 RepID=A0AAV4RGM6_9ARAC|nr:testis-expressed protein 2 [Caerostris darwini]